MNSHEEDIIIICFGLYDLALYAFLGKIEGIQFIVIFICLTSGNAETSIWVFGALCIQMCISIDLVSK